MCSLCFKNISLEETISGFKSILEGKYDNLPENAFYMVGNIDEAIAKAETLREISRGDTCLDNCKVEQKKAN